MDWIKRQLQGKDLDTILAYQTIKIVKIRDARLGAMYYISTIAIFLYIIISIILNQKYLAVEAPSAGSVRLNLKAPNNPANVSQLSYCTNSQNISCTYLPGQLIAPTLEDGSLLATTRMSIFNYDAPPGCNNPSAINTLPPTDANCLAKSGPSIPFYIADIERYTILVQHMVLGQETGLAVTTQQMPGKLIDQKGNTIQEFPADATSPGDIITIGNIIKAAGLEPQGLDQQSLSAGSTASMRYDGKVIVIYIDYNVRESSPDQLKYTYQVKPVPQSEFKWEETLYNNNGTVTILNRHGIRLVFKQTGKIGKFDFMALLVNLVASLALTRVAVFIVEFLMMNILPEKEHYTNAKVQATEDFDVYYKKNKDGDVQAQTSSNV